MDRRIPCVNAVLLVVPVPNLLNIGRMQEEVLTYVKLLLVLISCIFKLSGRMLSKVAVDRELEAMMFRKLTPLCRQLAISADENMVGPPGLTVRHAVKDTTITEGSVLNASPNVSTLGLLNAAAALRTLPVAKLAPLAIDFKFGQRPTVSFIFELDTFRTNVPVRLVPLVGLRLKLWHSVLTGVPDEWLMAIALMMGVRLIPTLVVPSRAFYVDVDRSNRSILTVFRRAVEGTALNLVFPRRRIRLFLRLADTNSRPLFGVHDRSADAVVVILVAFEP